MVSVYFRHQRVRKHQDKLMDDAYKALEAGKHFLCHAPTGMGKTDAALSVSLSIALKKGLSVLFLTPKTSQHKIALECVRGLNEKHGLGIRACDFVGKAHLCTEKSLSRSTPEDFYAVCERKRMKGTCEPYSRIAGRGLAARRSSERITKQFLEECGAAEDYSSIVKKSRGLNACGYELCSKLCENSTITIADYSQLFIPNIREVFLKKTKKSLDKLIVVVDEAHNVSPRVISHMSGTINSQMMSKAIQEAKKTGLSLDLKKAHREASAWAEKKLGEEKEVEVTRSEFNGLLGFGEDGASLAFQFEDAAAEFMELTGSERSMLAKLSKFFDSWENEDEASVRVLKRFGLGGYSVSKHCLDAGPLTSVLNECNASMLMSGTLVPLEMHRDLLRLDRSRCVMKEYASPFPVMNQLNILSNAGTTKFTKRTDDNYERLAARIDELVKVTPGNVGVFFPAFKVMGQVVKRMKSSNLLLQEEKMKPKNVSRLLKEFASTEGAVLCGVQGGSLSEGVDFPNGVMKCAVIVGVALQEKSLEVDGRIRYYDKLLGKGWEYGYLYPAVIKALQAAGRCVRSEKDRAVVVYLDERFSWKNYKKCLPGTMSFIEAGNPAVLAKKFW